MSNDQDQRSGRCYGYVRVSTAAQSEDGESLDVQKRKIKGYAMMHGLEVDKFYTERAVSGGKPLQKRAKGKELLDALQPGDVIICAKLDRIFRSALDALSAVEDFRKRNVHLHLIDLGGDVTASNGLARLFFTITAAFAEAERDRISERIVDVKNDQKGRGRYLGGTPPFGFKVNDDGTLSEVKKEQAAIKEMIRLRNRGLGLIPIAEAMHEEFGISISHMGVKKVLKRHGIPVPPRRVRVRRRVRRDIHAKEEKRNERKSRR